MFNWQNLFDGSDEKSGNAKTADNLPFYCIGFKSSAHELTPSTRIWASLHAQTLYRTISGVMNYANTTKLLYRIWNPEVVQLFGRDTDKLERALECMARRNSNLLFLYNVTQSSTLLNVRMPSSCYELILICRLLTLMRSHHNVKVVRRDCFLLWLTDILSLWWKREDDDRSSRLNYLEIRFLVMVNPITRIMRILGMLLYVTH